METQYLDLLKEIIRDYFVASAIMRVGIIFLTVLLLKILISFYKYNIRLSAFYESRKIALSHSGISDLERVKVFADILATEKINFESDDYNLKDILEIIKSIGPTK